MLTVYRELATLVAEVRKIGNQLDQMNPETTEEGNRGAAQKQASDAEDLDEMREDVRALQEDVAKMHDWMENMTKTVDSLLKMQKGGRRSEGCREG